MNTDSLTWRACGTGRRRSHGNSIIYSFPSLFQFFSADWESKRRWTMRINLFLSKKKKSLWPIWARYRPISICINDPHPIRYVLELATSSNHDLNVLYILFYSFEVLVYHILDFCFFLTMYNYVVGHSSLSKIWHIHTCQTRHAC